MQTLNKHKSKVTKLLHILPLNPNDTSESIFASGSADTTIIIWGCPNNVSSQYAPLTTLYGHSSSVNTMLQFNNDKLISDHVSSIYQKGNYLYVEIRQLDLDEYFDDKWQEWENQRQLENEEYWESRF